MHDKYGLLKVTCASIKTRVGNVDANVDEIISVIEQNRESDVILFSELSVTGYNLGKLFQQDVLLENAKSGVFRIAELVEDQLVLVGAPLWHDNGLYNCAFALNQGQIKFAQGKQNCCNYSEFIEGLFFRQANGSESPMADLTPFDFSFDPERPNRWSVPFGTRFLIRYKGHLFSVSICEDDFLMANHGDIAAAMGAIAHFNLSSSPEQVGKHKYRIDNIIVGNSAFRIAGMAYASSGPTDSTQGVVMGGHCGIAENGVLLKESRRVGDGEIPERGTYWITSDIDLKACEHQRMVMGTFGDHSNRIRQEQRNLGYEWREIPISLSRKAAPKPYHLQRKVDGLPFVPKDGAELVAIGNEIFGVQCCGLAKRLEQLPTPDMQEGISGGLDSTLAALAAIKTLDLLRKPRTHLHGVTMPGFGTSDQTYGNSWDFMRLSGMDACEAVDAQGTAFVRKMSLLTFQQLAHNGGYRVFGIIDPTVGMFNTGNHSQDVHNFSEALGSLSDEQIAKGDLVFENVQARHRTDFLMNRGFVLGTGDMSELALGWCTYNADHMSMYNPNCGIPKTLVAWVVKHVAMTKFDGELRDVLIDIANTVISPELLPHRNGQIGQSTEATIGSYTLHDFFLYNTVRGMHRPEKILYLADHADFGKEEFDRETIEKTLETFYQRFFTQQFKRDAVPNGPKVGTVSLDPRFDWRMPPDAEPILWLRDRGIEIQMETPF